VNQPGGPTPQADLPHDDGSGGCVYALEDRVREPLLEARIVTELREQFGVIGQQLPHDLLEGAVSLDAGVLPVRVLPGVLVGLVGGDLRRDHPVDLVQVLPLDVPEQLVKPGWGVP